MLHPYLLNYNILYLKSLEGVFQAFPRYLSRVIILDHLFLFLIFFIITLLLKSHQIKERTQKREKSIKKPSQ